MHLVDEIVNFRKSRECNRNMVQRTAHKKYCVRMIRYYRENHYQSLSQKLQRTVSQYININIILFHYFSFHHDANSRITIGNQNHFLSFQAPSKPFLLKFSEFSFNGGGFLSANSPNYPGDVDFRSIIPSPARLPPLSPISPGASAHRTAALSPTPASFFGTLLVVFG